MCLQSRWNQLRLRRFAAADRFRSDQHRRPVRSVGAPDLTQWLNRKGSWAHSRRERHSGSGWESHWCQLRPNNRKLRTPTPTTLRKSEVGGCSPLVIFVGLSSA
jgi:hypothetical protein